jgi:hypothetical protein
MTQTGDEDGLASQGNTKSIGETQMEQIIHEVSFNPPDEELTSGSIQPNEDNDLIQGENLDEVEQGETEVELVGREVSFDAPDAELMSGPINPNEYDDLLWEKNQSEVENEENQ